MAKKKEELTHRTFDEAIMSVVEGLNTPKAGVLLIVEGNKFKIVMVRAISNDADLSYSEEYLMSLGNPTMYNNYIG